MQLQKLGLHSHILPAVAAASREEGANEGYGSCDLEMTFEDLSSATVFDCRALDSTFVKDTGEAAFEEAKETGEKVRLPFASCYFEFSDEIAVLAQEWANYSGNIDQELLEKHDHEPEEGKEYLGTRIEVRTFLGWGDCGNGEEYAEFISNEHGYFTNGFDVPYGPTGGVPITEKLPFFECMNDEGNPAATLNIKEGAIFLLGALTLLNEHLLATEVRPDPAPRLNASRAKKGKLPLSCETRVLTINTGAVRRAVHGRKLLQHESPRLHWRRGHWRVLHRGSEFESKAWVRRCLVGDPSRGSVHKDYRVVWRQPMLEAG
jgi:hypothetical protein